MYARLLFVCFLTLYTLCTAFVLVWSDASFLIITALLLGGPLIVVWNRLHLQSHLIPLIATFTLLGTAILQLYAYKSGLWYELSPLSISILGGAPLEAYLFSVLHILYLILLYEYFFDDGVSAKRTKISARGLGIVGIIYSLILGMLYLDPTVLVNYPFAFLLALMSSLFALIILINKTLPSAALFKKAGMFTLAVFPLSLIYEWVMVENEIRIFANVNEYLGYFTWNGSIVPLEELLLLLLIPFGVVMIYEMFIDDSK
ncbi:MAG: hypothetical protein V4606_04910 [Patescibacteria group bacterium]